MQDNSQSRIRIRTRSHRDVRPAFPGGGRVDRNGASRFLLASAVAASALAAGAHAGTIHVSSFNDGADGWTSSVGGDVSWTSAGGDDGGGHLVFSDGSSAGTFVEAPTSWLGDWSALDGSGTLSFSHRIVSAPSRLFELPYEVVLEGAGGTARWTASSAAGTTDWSTVEIALDAGDWDVEGASWDELIADITRLAIRVELVANPGGSVDIEAIDSIRLAGSVVPGAPGLAIAALSLVGRRRRRA